MGDWNYELYIRCVDTSTSDTNRYAEPAGSQAQPSHAQLDLNYMQNFRLGGRLNLQLDADLFNVFDNQTGYNYEPRCIPARRTATPRNYYDPTHSSWRRVPVLSFRGASSRSDSPIAASARCQLRLRRAPLRVLVRTLLDRSASCPHSEQPLPLDQLPRRRVRLARACAMRAALSGSFSSTLTCARLNSAIG